MTIESIPAEVIALVMSFIPQERLHSAMAVCRSWKKCAEMRTVWCDRWVTIGSIEKINWMSQFSYLREGIENVIIPRRVSVLSALMVFKNTRRLRCDVSGLHNAIIRAIAACVPSLSEVTIMDGPSPGFPSRQVTDKQVRERLDLTPISGMTKLDMSLSKKRQLPAFNAAAITALRLAVLDTSTHMVDDVLSACQSLTDLSLSDVSFWSGIDVLRGLKRLSITNCFPGLSFPAPRMESLLFLKIDHVKNFSMENMEFSFPSLQSLHIDLTRKRQDDDAGDPIPEDIPNMHAPSAGCRISELHISIDALTDEFVSMLEGFKRLTRLCISCSDLDHGLLRRIVQIDTVSSLYLITEIGAGMSHRASMEDANISVAWIESITRKRREDASLSVHLRLRNLASIGSIEDLLCMTQIWTNIGISMDGWNR
jgi:hypothetical protein